MSIMDYINTHWWANLLVGGTLFLLTAIGFTMLLMFFPPWIMRVLKIKER